MSFRQSHFYRGATRQNPSFHLGDKIGCFLQNPWLLKGEVILAVRQARVPIPCTVRQVLHRRGWALSDAWWLEIQVPPDREITGPLSAQALTLDSPPPASIPARLLLLVPTQRMSAHSASSLLADAVYSTEIIAY